jgi:predicted PurR-regulated permease PerM/methanogenic corrinoid protein MtbC1
VKEPVIHSTPFDSDSDDSFDAGRATRPILAVIVATVVFYFGRQILVPLAMASMLAVIFSPVTSRLEPVVGRFISAALVVLAAIVAILAVGYFLTVELTGVAVEVSGYSNNIATKLSALEKSTPLWLQRVEHGVAEVEQRLEETNPNAERRKPTVVQTLPRSLGVSEVLKPAVPVLAAIGESLLVIVLLFFLLYSRRDLRDRFVRLAARARIPVAAQAMETAGDTVGRYLLLFSLTNLGFGIATGAVVWLLGLPNPEFWGGLGFLLRFIPYVGALTSAILPTLVAFAVFPGWSKTLEVLGTFVVLDQVAAQLVEPFLIGHGIGVSPLALLFSAMYWTWVWGLPGLLLATPLTACLKVAGDYIPALDFLAVLLGIDRPSEDYHEYYRRLLELDQTGARSLAVRYCDEHGLECTFNDIILPALVLMGEERSEDHISEQNQQAIVEATREIIAELGNRLSKPSMAPRLRVLGVCAPGDAHSLGLLMLLELLRQEGAAASFVGDNKSADEVRGFAKRFVPDVVCLSCVVTECLFAAAQLVQDLKMDSPQLTIIAGGAAAIAEPSKLLKAGCSQVCRSKSELRRLIRRYGLQRARVRVVGTPGSVPTGTKAQQDEEAGPSGSSNP